MFGVTIEGDFSPITELLSRMIEMRDRIGELADQVADEVLIGNEEGLLAGTDRYGQSMPPTQRQLDPKLSARLGGGNPLVPMDAGSRAIDTFNVTTEKQGDVLAVIGQWSNAPFIKYHKGPSGNRPERNIVGIRPETMERIKDRVTDWAESQFEGGG